MTWLQTRWPAQFSYQKQANVMLGREVLIQKAWSVWGFSESMINSHTLKGHSCRAIEPLQWVSPHIFHHIVNTNCSKGQVGKHTIADFKDAVKSGEEVYWNKCQVKGVPKSGVKSESILKTSAKYILKSGSILKSSIMFGKCTKKMSTWDVN